MSRGHTASIDPSIPNIAHHLAPGLLQWQCVRCGNSEGVEGRLDPSTGVLVVDINNSLHFLKLEDVHDGQVIRERMVAFHVNKSILDEGIPALAGKRRGEMTREERSRHRFGCGGMVRFISFAQENEITRIICKPDETRTVILETPLSRQLRSDAKN